MNLISFSFCDLLKISFWAHSKYSLSEKQLSVIMFCAVCSTGDIFRWQSHVNSSLNPKGLSSLDDHFATEQFVFVSSVHVLPSSFALQAEGSEQNGKRYFSPSELADLKIFFFQVVF